MRVRGGWGFGALVAALMMLACGGSAPEPAPVPSAPKPSVPEPGPTPAAPGPAPATTPTGGSGLPAASASALDARIQAVAKQGAAGLDRCAPLIAQLNDWTPTSGPVPFTADQLQEACGSFERLWREHQGELTGRTPGGNRTMGAIARVAEDVRILALAMQNQQPADGPYASAVDHIRRSVQEERAAMNEGATRSFGQDLRGPPPVLHDAAELRGFVLNRLDAHGREMTMVFNAHRNYAWNQLGSPSLYRSMLIEHFIRVQRAVTDADHAVVQAAQGDGVAPIQAAWGTYHAALDELVRTAEVASKPFLAGQHPIPEAKENYARVEAADAAWRAAREACVQAVSAL